MHRIFIFLLLPFFVFGEEVRICLTIVVKNDEEVIEQCLNSVKGIVDCVSICDIGSKDRTLKGIQNFLKKHQIPYEIQKLAMQEHGEIPRTLALETAQKFLMNLGFSSETSYLLVLEPDMILKIGGSFNKNHLDKDAYMVLEKSSALDIYSYNLRLLRASLKWESVDVIHEYWSCKEAREKVKLRTLMVEEKSTEKRRKEKLSRNVGLLQQALSQDPENNRYMFYLAQSYRCLQQYDDAIVWYKARIQKEESRDEVCFSKFMIGECYEEKQQWDHALTWYLEAFQCNPRRAEALRKIANYYRVRGQNDLAYLFAKHGSRIPIPNDQTLLPSPLPNEYQFDEELSIASYYTPFRDEGFAASSDLVIRRDVPWFIKDQAYRNLLFYVPHVSDQFRQIKAELPLIQKGSDERYHPMNPSIIKTEDGYELILRAVNYTQTGAKIFNTIDETGIFRTKNFLIHYDHNFILQSQHEIIENLPREKQHCIVQGLEDCRIFSYNDSLWFTCTTSNTNPTGQRQISLCKISDQRNGDLVKVENLIPMIGPDLNRCEKNWLPFVRDDHLYFVYSYDPFIIFKPNLQTGECETIFRHYSHLDFSGFRGSAGPLPFDDGYLLLVHEVAISHDYERSYLHRFLFLDKDFKINRLSRPFTFRHHGVEFCCSMVIDHSGKQLVMPIGIEDREAYLCFVDLEKVRSLLLPLPFNHEPPFENR